MTVDVEDYFQVSAFENYISRDSWNKLNTRVEANIERILLIFSDHNVSATFFTLGWIAERHPEMVKKIVDAGHELASHGYSHIRVTQQNPSEFREDIVKTKGLLEDIGGVEVQGYRAASYSIDSSNHQWAHEALDAAGHKYSSSIYPIKHDLYGIPDAPRHPYKITNLDLLEIPISTISIYNHRLPCGGGGFFRLFPYMISRKMIEHVNQKEQEPCMFYFHPWEIDIDQPVVKGLNFKSRFRHYLNLKKMNTRLTRLLDDFTWGRVDSVYLDRIA
ncbi:MAG: DUF3473 domain-containing protein [Gammaproteobacteria bacterium]|nr:DUF3473 domain-containing protein [Gammaproteobacteria bacterium]